MVSQACPYRCCPIPYCTCGLTLPGPLLGPRRAVVQTSVRYPQVAHATPNYLTLADVDEITKEFKRFQLDDPEYARQLEQV